MNRPSRLETASADGNVKICIRPVSRQICLCGRTYCERYHGAFGALRQLRQIRRSVPTATLQMLVVRLVLLRLDFGNSVLVGIPACLLRRLQSVLNAGARLIFQLRRWPHHWCSSQSTLATNTRAHPIQDRRTDVQGSPRPRHSATVPWTTRPSSRSAWSAGTPLCQLQSPGGCRCSDCLQPVVGPSTFLNLGSGISGMDCPKTLFRRQHFQVSGADLNPSFSNSHTWILSS